jgi:UDP-4-amino-4,6-dideoxy-L-N-acetyl-beta-L-altrosamine transaminase
MEKLIPYGRQSINSDDCNAVCQVLKSDFLTTGPKIKEFEKKISEYTGARYAVVVSNGTAALHLASLALLSPGDTVLTSPNSFLATANAVLYANARPQFIDIIENGIIDLELCEKELKKNNRNKAIYAIQFSGNPVDQDKLAYLRKTYDIKILEDCAHSLGAVFFSQNGSKTKSGSCQNSDLSILSFHPVKHLTTGEGGAITTNSERLYQQLLSLRNHGMVSKAEDLQQQNMSTDEKGNRNPWYYEMQQLGFNYRLTDIQCALGIEQFKRLDGFVNRRREIARKYDRFFVDLDWVKPLYPYNKNSSYHLYVLLFDFKKLGMTRAEFFFKLKEMKIGVQVHYIPINKQPYYRQLGYGNEVTPCMDHYYTRAVSIPMFPALKDMEQNHVIQTILDLN